MSDSRQARCFEESQLLLDVHKLNEMFIKLQSSNGDLKKTDLLELKKAFELLKNEVIAKKNFLSLKYKEFCSKNNVSEEKIQQEQLQPSVEMVPVIPSYQPKKISLKPKAVEKKWTPHQDEKKVIIKEQPAFHNDYAISLPVVDKIIKRTALDSKEKEIWFDTSRFFEGLPSRSDVERILDSSSPEEIYVSQPKVHWSEQFKTLIKNTKQKGKRLQEPPGPPPSGNEFSKYWKENIPPFQIEEEMYRNVSAAHRILSCLVISPPIMKKGNNKKKKFMKTNYLAPRIPYDPYLGLSFEEKLDLELAAIGLSNPNGYSATPDDGPFAQEISKYKEDLSIILPKISKTREEILLNLENYRLKEQKRKRETQAFMDLYVDENA